MSASTYSLVIVYVRRALWTTSAFFESTRGECLNVNVTELIVYEEIEAYNYWHGSLHIRRVNSLNFVIVKTTRIHNYRARQTEICHTLN